MRSGFARETGEPPRAGTVAERSAAAFTKSRRADARNDRPEGRSPSRKTGRIKSLGVRYAVGQPPGTSLDAGGSALGGRPDISRAAVLLVWVVVAGCTPLADSARGVPTSATPSGP